MERKCNTLPEIPKTTLTLAVNGELDHHRAKEMIEEIRSKIDCTLPKKLVLDLKGLTFSDSSGIAVLLRVSRSMAQIEGELEIIQVQPQPWRLFQAAGLQKILCIHQDQ